MKFFFSIILRIYFSIIIKIVITYLGCPRKRSDDIFLERGGRVEGAGGVPPEPRLHPTVLLVEVLAIII